MKNLLTGLSVIVLAMQCLPLFAQEINFSDLKREGTPVVKRYIVSGIASDGRSYLQHFDGVDTARIQSYRAATQAATNTDCYKIKNDALKAYCERGESACSEFGFRSNKSKFNIPDWVEDFCRSNYTIREKNLEDYYRYGYTAQFKDSEIYKSANKYISDIGSRKRWVIYYSNGVLLKAY